MKTQSCLFMCVLSIASAAAIASSVPERSIEELAGMKTPDVAACLEHWSPITRHRAAEELASRGADAVPPAIAAMKHANPAVRRAGCDVIERLCDERFAARRRGMKQREAQAVGRQEASPAVGPLSRLLSDADPWVRSGAAEALAGLGPVAQAAQGDLFRLLADSDEWAQEFSAVALASVGIDKLDGKRLYPILLKLLQHRRAGARKAVVRMLDQMGDAARPAAAALLTSVKDRCPDAMFGDGPRIEAIKLLAKWKAPEAVPACIILLDEPRWGRAYRVQNALQVLRELGPAAKDAAPAIERFMAEKGDDDRLKTQAQRTLAAIGGKGK